MNVSEGINHNEATDTTLTCGPARSKNIDRRTYKSPDCQNNKVAAVDLKIPMMSSRHSHRLASLRMPWIMIKEIKGKQTPSS